MRECLSASQYSTDAHWLRAPPCRIIRDACARREFAMDHDPLTAVPASCERAEPSHVPPISANFNRPPGEEQQASPTAETRKTSNASSLGDTLLDVEPAQRSSMPFPLLVVIPDANCTAGFQPSKVLFAIGTMTRRVFGHVSKVWCLYPRVEDTVSQPSR